MNYALVGGFVLLLGAVLVAGALWLASGGAFQKKYDPVSYTHLTLPTSDLGSISGVAVSLKKKTKHTTKRGI